MEKLAADKTEATEKAWGLEKKISAAEQAVQEWEKDIKEAKAAKQAADAEVAHLKSIVKLETQERKRLADALDKAEEVQEILAKGASGNVLEAQQKLVGAKTEEEKAKAELALKEAQGAAICTILCHALQGLLQHVYVHDTVSCIAGFAAPRACHA